VVVLMALNVVPNTVTATPMITTEMSAAMSLYSMMLGADRRGTT